MSYPRVAIVGCGLLGEKRMKLLPSGVVTWTCDLDRSRAQALSRQGQNCFFSDSIEETVTAPNVDVVLISTVNASLAPVACRAAQAGKDVLVEKPAAVRLQEIEQLEEVAQKNGALVRVGYNHRYHPAFLRACQIFQTGELGRIMFIRGRYGHGGRVGYDKEWRADPNLSGGGELIDQGVHLIDLAGIFLGEFTAVDGHTATYYWDMPVDDNAFLSLRNVEGKTAWLHASCTEWKNTFSFEIYGTKGKLHFEGLGGSYGVERLSFYRMLPEMGPPETLIYEYSRSDESLKLEMQEFFEDIRLRRIPIPGIKEAKAVLSVVEKIYNKRPRMSGEGGSQTEKAGVQSSELSSAKGASSVST